MSKPFDAAGRMDRLEEHIRREFGKWPEDRRRDFANDLAAIATELLGECPDQDEDAALSVVDPGPGIKQVTVQVVGEPPPPPQFVSVRIIKEPQPAGGSSATGSRGNKMVYEWPQG